jgi:hypothetical protein
MLAFSSKFLHYLLIYLAWRKEKFKSNEFSSHYYIYNIFNFMIILLDVSISMVNIFLVLNDDFRVFHTDSTRKIRIIVSMSQSLV